MNKKRVIIWITAALAIAGPIAAAEAADPLFRLTFDNGEISTEADVSERNFEIGTYVPGDDEVVHPSTNRILVKYFERSRDFTTDRPVLTEAGEIAPDPPQGGNALRVYSGGKSQGLLIDLAEAIPPGDLTLELVWLSKTIEPEGNNFKLTYLGSNEWPFGDSFHWAIRRAPDQPFNLTVFAGPGNETRIPAEEPIAENRWYHTAAVLDYNDADPASSTVRLFQNGVLQGEKQYDASEDVFSLGSSHTRYGHCFALGYSAGQDANLFDNRGLDGAIDAFAASREALSRDAFVLPVPE